MRSIHRAVALSVSLLMLIPPSAMAKPGSPTVLQALADANQNPGLSEWIYQYEGNMMRAKLDLAVANLLETDKDARKALEQATAEINNMVDLQELTLDVSTGRASKTITPDSKTRTIVQDAARGHGFSPEAVDNLKLWTTFGSVNAYTFSPLHDRLDVVVYQELVDMMVKKDGSMDEGALKAVFAHELGHIHMKHVLTGVVVQAIFDASGRILIPDEAKKVAFRSAVSASGAELLKKAIDFDGPIANQIVKALQKHATLVGARLAAELGEEGMARLANKFNRALGKQDLFEIKDGKADLVIAKDDSTGTMGDIKGFKDANTRLTRDQERTADRWGVLVAGPQALIRSMAKLAGGRMGLGSSALKQAREVLQMANDKKIDLTELDTADHPNSIIRVAAALQFAQSRNYKVMNDPFLRVTDMYLKMKATQVAQTKTMEANKIEQITADSLMFDNSALGKSALEMEDAIVGEIVNEVTAQTSLNQTKKFLGAIDSAQKERPFDTELMKKYELFNKLRSSLTALGDNATAKALLAEIDSRVPQTAMEKSMSALEKTLKSAKPAAVSCPAVLIK